MLEKLDLSASLSREEYQARLPDLQRRIFEAQTACWQAGVGSLFVFEGWDASGVGACLNLLAERLDPRGIRIYGIMAPRTYETHMPWLWRFWRRVPDYGRIAIFDRSWYRRVLDERVEKEVPRRVWLKGYVQIAGFERALADDGYLVRKFFFHISRKEQKKRLEKEAGDPLNGRRRDPDWRKRHRKYGKYLAAAEDMLARTEAEWAPWTLVEATDRRWARIKVFEEMVRALEGALEARKVA